MSLEEFLSTYGKVSTDPGFLSQYDYDQDGDVDGADYAAFLAEFGDGNDEQENHDAVIEICSGLNAWIEQETGTNPYVVCPDFNEDSQIENDDKVKFLKFINFVDGYGYGGVGAAEWVAFNTNVLGVTLPGPPPLGHDWAWVDSIWAEPLHGEMVDFLMSASPYAPRWDIHPVYGMPVEGYGNVPYGAVVLPAPGGGWYIHTSDANGLWSTQQVGPAGSGGPGKAIEYLKIATLSGGVFEMQIDYSRPPNQRLRIRLVGSGDPWVPYPPQNTPRSVMFPEPGQGLAGRAVHIGGLVAIFVDGLSTYYDAVERCVVATSRIWGQFEEMRKGFATMRGAYTSLWDRLFLLGTGTPECARWKTLALASLVSAITEIERRRDKAGWYKDYYQAFNCAGFVGSAEAEVHGPGQLRELAALWNDGLKTWNDWDAAITAQQAACG